MTLPVPVERTWSTNDIASAAFLNSNLRDGINFLLNPPLLLCYSAGLQSLSNNTWTSLTMDTNVIDTYNGHSTSSNTDKYFAQVAGYYLVIARAGFALNSTGNRGVGIGVNGASVTTTTPQIVNPPTASALAPVYEVTCLVQLAVGGYVSALGFQTSGGALSTSTGYPSLQAIFVHS